MSKGSHWAARKGNWFCWSNNYGMERHVDMAHVHFWSISGCDGPSHSAGMAFWSVSFDSEASSKSTPSLVVRVVGLTEPIEVIGEVAKAFHRALEEFHFEGK